MTDLRTLERASIRAFVQKAADDGYLSGRVLDYGCGRQPYRDIVEAGGEYEGFDSPHFPASVVSEGIGTALSLVVLSTEELFSTILCTQVVQYVPQSDYGGLENPLMSLLNDFRAALRKDGHLVLTWPICWPLVEDEDLHRFTVSGMRRLLTEAGFEIIACEVRAEYNGFPIGGQAVARA